MCMSFTCATVTGAAIDKLGRITVDVSNKSSSSDDETIVPLLLIVVIIIIIINYHHDHPLTLPDIQTCVVYVCL